ncbi:Rsd/AlgQ family anti-sigma factor [Haliea sp. E17]|uniref:Rsd/AlgQ family anti-sigma factor n=1 Tax=Haliea sp. E17 TaxID=3401576 RepID=UPI003AAC20F3
MPQSHRDTTQQFDDVEDLLGRWLKERRVLLARYTQVATIVSAQLSLDGLARSQREFCEVLVDYISAGHFEVYLKLLDEAESYGDGSDALAVALIPAITDTTEFILAYEEKYAPDFDDTINLDRDLSALGEMLESRFTLEDQLIAGLHNSHRRQSGN